MRAYNFSASGNNLKETFPRDVLRGRHNNFGTTFKRPASLKFQRAKTSKIRRDFGELQTLIANVSGMEGDIENRKSK